MDRIHLERFSYRFAEQVLNSKLAIKQEIESILASDTIQMANLSRPAFNKILRESFVAKGWTDQPHVFSEEDELGAKMDFLKERVGIEVGFSHASFIGIDLLKFQVSS
jgi:Restriction endonuclease BglII